MTARTSAKHKAEPAPVGNWSAIELEDGSRQLAYKNFPEFTFVKNTKPGEVVEGEHFGNGQLQAVGFRAILASSQMRLYP